MEGPRAQALSKAIETNPVCASTKKAVSYALAIWYSGCFRWGSRVRQKAGETGSAQRGKHKEERVRGNAVEKSGFCRSSSVTGPHAGRAFIKDESGRVSGFFAREKAACFPLDAIPLFCVQKDWMISMHTALSIP